jgi:hypothetical protein
MRFIYCLFGLLLATSVNESAENNTVQWVEEETGKVLFTSQDMRRFDWDQQVFELDRERAMDLLSLPSVHQCRFIVRDAKGEIYRGYYQSSASSFVSEDPSIIIDMIPLMSPKPPLYKIEERILEQSSGARRFNPRLKQRLEAAGLIRSIKIEDVKPIEARFFGWEKNLLARSSSTEFGDRKAAVILFPETVHIGRDIRFTLRFNGRGVDDTLYPMPDKVKATITLRANNLRTKTFDIPVEILAKGFSEALPLRMWPWSESGRSIDSVFQPGPATMDISIASTKQNSTGDVSNIGKWLILVDDLQILPRSD